MSCEVLKAYSHSTSELVRDILQCNFTSYEKSWKVLRVDTPCQKETWSYSRLSSGRHNYWPLKSKRFLFICSRPKSFCVALFPVAACSHRLVCFHHRRARNRRWFTIAFSHTVESVARTRPSMALRSNRWCDFFQGLGILVKRPLRFLDLSSSGKAFVCKALSRQLSLANVYSQHLSAPLLLAIQYR
jgi:hypothetical protein